MSLTCPDISEFSTSGIVLMICVFLGTHLLLLGFYSVKFHATLKNGSFTCFYNLHLHSCLYPQPWSSVSAHPLSPLAPPLLSFFPVLAPPLLITHLLSLNWACELFFYIIGLFKESALGIFVPLIF